MRLTAVKLLQAAAIKAPRGSTFTVLETKAGWILLWTPHGVLVGHEQKKKLAGFIPWTLVRNVDFEDDFADVRDQFELGRQKPGPKPKSPGAQRKAEQRAAEAG